MKKLTLYMTGYSAHNSWARIWAHTPPMVMATAQDLDPGQVQLALGFLSPAHKTKMWIVSKLGFRSVSNLHWQYYTQAGITFSQCCDNSWKKFWLGLLSPPTLRQIHYIVSLTLNVGLWENQTSDQAQIFTASILHYLGTFLAIVVRTLENLVADWGYCHQPNLAKFREIV